MAPRQHKEPTSARGPFWYPDASARLRALLPELAVSVVAMTCMTTVMSYHDGSNVTSLVVAMAAIQLVVQTSMYVCTYLARDSRVFAVPLLLLTLTTPVYSMTFASIFTPADFGLMEFAIPLSIVSGTMLFFLIRTRVGLVLTFIEVLGLGMDVDQIPALWAVHTAGFAALSVLLVMRSSAAHITRDSFVEEGPPEAGDDDAHEPGLGIYAQVAALGALVGAVCLALALGGTVLVKRDMAGSSQAVSETASPSTDDTAVTHEAYPDEDVAPVQQPEEGSDAHTVSHAVAGALALALLLAALALPVPVRLSMRWHARRSLAHVPQPADRAARLYQAIVARLAAAGVVRDEAETPGAFLDAHGQELKELTAPADIDLIAWAQLTGIYERARYAELAPTDDELALCWRIYDALPGCARVAAGWRRYLLGPFWRM